MRKLNSSSTGIDIHPKVEVGMNSLRFLGDLSDEEMLEVCGVLRRIEGTLAWLVGDFLCEVGRLRGDSRASELIEYFGVGERWAYHAWLTCRKWPVGARVQGCSFTHHRDALQEAGSLEEALPWARRAAAEGWSVAEMRRQMRAKPPGAAGAKRLSFSDLYGAVAWARRIAPAALTETDRATLRQDLRPLIDFYQQL